MRIVRMALVLLALIIAGSVMYGSTKNPEKATLGPADRATAPGKFVGSSLGMTHYEVTGPDTGDVVVLVHGFSVPMYIWDSLFYTLGDAGYRTIRYDLFGRGLSDRPDAAYDGAMYDRQLDELLDSLRIHQPINLMGVSFGGFVTAHYVAGHQSRVNTLTLFDPAARSRPLPFLLTVPVIGPWVWQTTHVPTMAEGQPSDFLHPEHFPDWVERYRPQMRYRGFGRALLRSAQTMAQTNFDSLYVGAGRTLVPALLIWGKQDSTVPIPLSAVVRNGLQQIEFLPVDSAGHLPYMEQPAVVRARVLKFLVGHPLPRSMP